MRARAAIATVLLGLFLTGCSSENKSASSTTSTPAPSCTDFNAQSFTGLPVARANDVKAQGWAVEFAHADTPEVVGYRAPADGTIDGVTKRESGCLVIFTIRVAPSFATTSRCSPLMDNYFIGSPPSKASEATSYGWTFTLWDDAGNTSWETSQPWEIGAVEKDLNTCSVRFKVVADGPITPAASMPPAGPLTTVSDGTYLVGTDMVAGSYKSPGSSNGCYWARLKDDSGRNIIAYDLVSGPGPARFTAKTGEYVKVSLCTFTKV